MSRAPYIAWIVCLTALLGLGTLYLIRHAGQPAASSISSVATSGRIGGAFTLVDQDNRPVTEKSWPGKYLLLYFGFTRCPDVCPTGLNTIAEALKQLTPDEAAKIQPIFITVDPARDTPAALKEYVPLFHARLVGLTGSEQQIEHVKKLFRVYAEKQGAEADYMVNHSAYTYLLTPTGGFDGLYGHDITAKEIAAAIRTSLSRDIVK